jgi:hypothetical protein
VTLFDANQSPLKLGLFTIANVISWDLSKQLPWKNWCCLLVSPHQWDDLSFLVPEMVKCGEAAQLFAREVL